MVWNTETTRWAAAQELESMGVTGDAADALLKETGSFRHNWRIEQAREAALARGVDVIGEANLWSRMVAIATLEADLFGVGGTDGVSGHATTRIKGLGLLGKGRKQAADGDAWTAAIQAAASQLRRDVSEELEAGHGAHWSMDCYLINGQAVLSIVAWDGIYDPEPKVAASIDLDTAQIDIAWQRTIAREGLRIAAGLDRWTPVDIRFTGELAAWAAAVNQLVARGWDAARICDVAEVE
jgi:hypothetical protein